MTKKKKKVYNSGFLCVHLKLRNPESKYLIIASEILVLNHVKKIPNVVKA